jgi:probable rRNA maturation factor
MKQSPIQNATSVSVDLENLHSVYLSIKDALGIKRSFAIRLVDSEEMIQLNTSFRGCPEDTDVLTFPSGLDDPMPLGDIAIGIPYARDQAEMRGVSLDNEITALLVHGVLHLLGYDDILDNDRKVMQQKMNEVGEQIGIPIDGNWTSILHQDDEQQ